MLVIAININVFLLAGLLVVSFILGYMLRRSYMRHFFKKIVELEKEMLNNHAEILELEKEKATLLRQMKESQIPVIPIKSPKEDDKKGVGT